MAIPQRQHAPGTYFVTSVTWNRRRLFQVEANVGLFLAALQHYRHEGHYKLHAFVIVPDHIHLLLTPQHITLERALMLIKGGFSHRLHATHPVWQRSFTDHRIRNRADFDVTSRIHSRQPRPRPPLPAPRRPPLVLSPPNPSA